MVQLTSDFEPKKMVISPTVEKNKRGGKVVYISGEQGRVLLQTPTMSLPFGVTPYDVNGDIQSDSVELSFRGHETDPRLQDFLAKVKELDEYLIDTATEHSEAWFGKKQSREMVAEFYRRLVNDKNPEYPPFVKMKVGAGMNGAPNAEFYDEKRQPVGIDYLTKGSCVKVICEISSIWFVNKTFGASFRISQAAVVSKPNRLQGYSFQDEE